MKKVILTEENLKNIIKESVRKVLRKTLKEDLDRTIIIYHSADWDGYTSGAVALMANPNSDLFGWNYNDPAPDVSNYSKVILVDLTIGQRGDFSWMIENSDKLIWIDHHANVIGNPQLQNIEGIRKDGIGACILAWEYFFGGKIPPHVALCGTYDVFRKDGAYADWEDAWAYQLALANVVNIPRTGGKDSVIGVETAMKFIKEPIQNTIKRIEIGESLESDRANYEKELFNAAQFVQRGNIRICKLISGKGTPAHNIKTNSDNHTADVFLLRSPETIDGEHYKIAIRVPERSNVDASAIARKYGGNGHVKAAGCLMTMEEFENI